MSILFIGKTHSVFESTLKYKSTRPLIRAIHTYHVSIYLKLHNRMLLINMGFLMIFHSIFDYLYAIQLIKI